MGSDYRITYHRELEAVDSDIMHLGALVCETIPRGTEALLEGDFTLNQALIDADDEIDRLAVEAEERCHSILVRQAPMAGELRQVVTAVKLVAELERSGDLMVNVCKASRRMLGSPMSPKIRGLVTAMSKEASRLMRLALDSYADKDADLARALADIDDELDQLNRDMVSAIFEAHSANQIDLAASVQLALVARYYERIGDHAVNIGERVNFMISGWSPEHLGAMRQNIRHEGAVSLQGEYVWPEASKAPLSLGVVVIEADGQRHYLDSFAKQFDRARHSDVLVAKALDEVAERALAGQATTRPVETYGPPARGLLLRGMPTVSIEGVDGAVVVIEDQTALDQVDQVRKDFVANVGHELRTPVGAVGLLAETLRDSEDPEVVRNLSNRLYNEALRLGSMIDDLLTLSRYESGPIVNPVLVSMAEVVELSVDHTWSAAEARGVTINVEVETSTIGSDSAESLVVLGDQAQLVSALTNLIDNAVKYSDVGTSVAVKLERSKQWVEVSVVDSGIGIPEAELSRVFQRFYRVGGDRGRSTGGTGLGLSIVRHVVSNHSGSVLVQSTVGVGSTFVIQLPVYD